MSKALLVLVGLPAVGIQVIDALSAAAECYGESGDIRVKEA